jgi:hypothetical protein
MHSSVANEQKLCTRVTSRCNFFMQMQMQVIESTIFRAIRKTLIRKMNLFSFRHFCVSSTETETMPACKFVFCQAICLPVCFTSLCLCKVCIGGQYKCRSVRVCSQICDNVFKFKFILFCKGQQENKYELVRKSVTVCRSPNKCKSFAESE